MARPTIRSRTSSRSAPTQTLSPETLALIQHFEQATFDITVVVRHDDDVRYIMTVGHRGAKLKLQFSRSFDEYHLFQERLLVALHHGHFCSANCPWLESFLISYFPAKSGFLFGHIINERRRAGLSHVFETIKTFLSDRSNYTCNIVAGHVAAEFLEFIGGELVECQQHSEQDDFHADDVLSNGSRASYTGTRASFTGGRASSIGGNYSFLKSNSAPVSTDSTVSSGSSDGRRSFIASAPPSPPDSEPETCTLCSLSMPVKNIYVMQLRCGHRFHDECILPKLNEALNCPTCGKSDVA